MYPSHVVESLGERIVRVARMAVAAHVQGGISEDESARMLRHQVEIGRAGRGVLSDSQRGNFVTDDGLPPATDRLE